jgi:hypothetical protein
MNSVDVVARARSACNKGTAYGLGKGGFHPDLAHPGSLCDCSGFAAWVFGSPRKVPSTIGWIETSRIVRDATGDQLLFRRVFNPEPGDAIVYGDYEEQVSGRHRQGHVGVLVHVAPRPFEDPEWWSDSRVVHCSVSNDKRGDAIQETDCKGFASRYSHVVFARWIGTERHTPPVP